jgi:hypothetical protein
MATTTMYWKRLRVFGLACLFAVCTVAWADDNVLLALFTITDNDQTDSSASSRYIPPQMNSSLQQITDTFIPNAMNAQHESVSVTWKWSASGAPDIRREGKTAKKLNWTYKGAAPHSSTDGTFTTTLPVDTSSAAQRWVPPAQLATASTDDGNY